MSGKKTVLFAKEICNASSTLNEGGRGMAAGYECPRFAGFACHIPAFTFSTFFCPTPGMDSLYIFISVAATITFK